MMHKTNLDVQLYKQAVSFDLCNPKHTAKALNIAAVI